MIDREKFYQDGYGLCPEILNNETISKLHAELQRFARVEKNPYIYESEVIQSVVFGPEIRRVASQVLGDKFVYLPDYSFNAVDFWASFGWHKDSVDRYDSAGADWNEKCFPIIRFGIYLGDYSFKTGSLGLQRASNKGPLYANSGINVKTKPGDVVVWPLTTTHTANSPSFKSNPTSALTPPINLPLVRGLTNKLGNFVNKRKLGLQENLPNRQVLFFSVAKPGPHLARYMSFLLHRKYFRDFINSDPEKGEIYSRSPDCPQINWLKVNGLMDLVDKDLISTGFDQLKAQAASKVVFSELMESF